MTKNEKGILISAGTGSVAGGTSAVRRVIVGGTTTVTSVAFYK